MLTSAYFCRHHYKIQTNFSHFIFNLNSKCGTHSLYLAPITANNTPDLTQPVELFMIRFVCFFLWINLFVVASAFAYTDTFRQYNFAPRLLLSCDTSITFLVQSASSMPFRIIFRVSYVLILLQMNEYLIIYLTSRHFWQPITITLNQCCTYCLDERLFNLYFSFQCVHMECTKMLMNFYCLRIIVR